MSYFRNLQMLLFVCCCMVNGQLTAANYQEYVINWEPLKKNQKLNEEYWKIFGNLKEPKTFVRQDLVRALEIIETVSTAAPTWIDGYWLLGSTAYQLASTYTEEKDLPLARKLFVRAQKATEDCLKLIPSQPLCKLFLGTAIGSIGSIDGILSSLKNAGKIEKLWIEVMNSGINYHFFPKISMQGSVRYGLGMFYRLVPDMWIIQWFFDVRGSLDKSIKMHREGIAVDGTNICSDLMLAVSLVCHAKGDKSLANGKEGIELLEKTASSSHENVNMKICIADARKISNDLNLACGYTTAKQQDLSEEAVNKKHKH